jgi:hypothetical protein
MGLGQPRAGAYAVENKWNRTSIRRSSLCRLSCPASILWCRQTSFNCIHRHILAHAAARQVALLFPPEVLLPHCGCAHTAYYGRAANTAKKTQLHRLPVTLWHPGFSWRWIFWDVMPCSLVAGYQSSDEGCMFFQNHIQDYTVSHFGRLHP